MTPVQQRILSIFRCVAEVCAREGIPYYAIGGTCLGAVRHKGFIPWDDDLDIAVPVEDYERLLSALSKTLPPHLFVYSHTTVHHYHYVWAKVCDRNSTFIERVDRDFPDAYKGVFVDIMPLSGVPVPGAARRRFYRRLPRFQLLNDIRRFGMTTGGRKVPLLGWLLSVFPVDTFSKGYLRVLKGQPYRGSAFTGYVWHHDTVRRLTFPSSWFGEGCELPFEDMQIRCPADPGAFLGAMYGDYMTLPPEEKRVVHLGLVELDKPFSEYVAKA
jgi:lipopolysaccharide cholinephosphotransferase